MAWGFFSPSCVESKSELNLEDAEEEECLKAGFPSCILLLHKGQTHEVIFKAWAFLLEECQYYSMNNISLFLEGRSPLYL